MEKTILTKNQTIVLECLSKEKILGENFYLTGGTALAEFYLRHRLSEDLDFFSEKEFAPEAIYVLLKKIQKKIGLKKIDFQQSFNRNLFFLSIGKDIIKTEFTYFPFPRITQHVTKKGLQIDSLLDIAVNKVFTIYQKPRSRDFIDLYFIFQKEKWSFEDLIKKTKIKFDWHVDPIQMGSRLTKATELKDFPKMIKKLDNSIWQQFFLKKARKLSPQIFE